MFLGTQTPFLRWKGRGSKGNTSIFCYSSPRLNAWSLHQKSTSSNWLQHCPEQAKVPGGQRTFPPPPPCSRHFFFFLSTLPARTGEVSNAELPPPRRGSAGQQLCSPRSRKPSNHSARALHPSVQSLRWQARQSSPGDLRKVKAAFKKNSKPLLTLHPMRSAALEPGSAPTGGGSLEILRGVRGERIVHYCQKLII